MLKNKIRKFLIGFFTFIPSSVLLISCYKKEIPRSEINKKMAEKENRFDNIKTLRTMYINPNLTEKNYDYGWINSKNEFLKYKQKFGDFLEDTINSELNNFLNNDWDDFNIFYFRFYRKNSFGPIRMIDLKHSEKNLDIVFLQPDFLYKIEKVYTVTQDIFSLNKFVFLPKQKELRKLNFFYIHSKESLWEYQNYVNSDKDLIKLINSLNNN